MMKYFNVRLRLYTVVIFTYTALMHLAYRVEVVVLVWWSALTR